VFVLVLFFSRTIPLYLVTIEQRKLSVGLGLTDYKDNARQIILLDFYFYLFEYPEQSEGEVSEGERRAGKSQAKGREECVGGMRGEK
jgi:hypothetical protein